MPTAYRESESVSSVAKKSHTSTHIPQHLLYTTENAPTAQGLVQSHISPRSSFPASITQQIRVTVYANLVKVHVPQDERKGGGVRGKISEFTAASRKRQLEFLMMLRSVDRGMFITLTYPAVWPESPEVWKEHLDTFLKRVNRVFPGAYGVWRIEPQKRGAPHYHLILFGMKRGVNRVRQWVKLAWYKIVGSGDEKHLKAGTQVDAINSHRHAIAYASKYTAKHDNGVPRRFTTPYGEVVTNVGKHWGKFNSKFADTSASVAYSIVTDGKPLVELRRMASRYLKSCGSNYARRMARGKAGFGLSVFGLGDSSHSWEKINSSTVFRMLAAAHAIPLTVFLFSQRPKNSVKNSA